MQIPDAWYAGICYVIRYVCSCLLNEKKNVNFADIKTLSTAICNLKWNLINGNQKKKKHFMLISSGENYFVPYITFYFREIHA